MLGRVLIVLATLAALELWRGPQAVLWGLVGWGVTILLFRGFIEKHLPDD